MSGDGFVSLYSFLYSFRSTDIRWSMDLRWQHPQLPNGREPSEKMPLMRSRETPVKEIDWSVLSNRQQNDRKNFLEQTGEDSNFTEDEFETRLGGPWMRRWPIKHHNENTDYEIGKSN